MSADGTVNPARIATVILAAGGSTRLGRPKQLLNFRGEPLVTRAARVAGNVGCFPVIVVTGANAPEVASALESTPFVHPVFNPDWESGMGSSIAVGVSALLTRSAPFDAVLLLVCDQLLVSTESILRLCEAHRETGKSVVASGYGNVWGVPCLFDRVVLPELAGLRGAGGAKPIIERYREKGDAVSVLFPGGLCDVDTPADWERWQQFDGEKPPLAT